MQVTIDSSDSLDHALRVLGSLYGVQLTVAGSPDGPVEESSKSSRQGSSRRPGKGTSKASRRRAGSNRAPAKDLTAVRAWARDSGYEVSDRGRVPNAVLDAYQQAQSGS